MGEVRTLRERVCFMVDDDLDDDAFDNSPRSAKELSMVFEVPVRVSAVIGKVRMRIRDLMSVEEGQVIVLDRKVGEAVDVYANNRLVARGEVVIVDNSLGINMTEIIKADEG